MSRLSTNGGLGWLMISQIKAIWPRMSLRPLLAMLFAFAMLFAPLATQGGAAMAMTPTDHHAQMMESGHCGEQPAKGDHDKAADKSCCVAMCAAVAVAPATYIEPHSFSRPVERPALDQFQRSFLAELPTPPPRLA
jgi:hypothetical protein